MPVEKLVTVVKEVPVEVIVDRVVPTVTESVKIIEIERPTVLVVEVPKVIDRSVEVPYEVVKYITNEVHLVEKIEVPVAVEVVQTKIQEV